MQPQEPQKPRSNDHGFIYILWITVLASTLGIIFGGERFLAFAGAWCFLSLVGTTIFITLFARGANADGKGDGVSSTL